MATALQCYSLEEEGGGCNLKALKGPQVLFVKVHISLKEMTTIYVLERRSALIQWSRPSHPYRSGMSALLLLPAHLYWSARSSRYCWIPAVSDITFWLQFWVQDKIKTKLIRKIRGVILWIFKSCSWIESCTFIKNQTKDNSTNKNIMAKRRKHASIFGRCKPQLHRLNRFMVI
jgi:hypothetical protein